MMLQYCPPVWLFISFAAITGANADPCAVIGGKKWVEPREARACMSSFPVDPKVKSNIIEVLNKTLAFHTSVNYQIQAPKPFEEDVHEDLLVELARISGQDYASDFDLHVDLFRTFKRVNDGHCAYINYCYDSLYVTYIPIPLVFLTEPDGSQNTYIAPEAFEVASAEFKDEIEFWQNALPGILKGQLSSLSGAKVLLINGDDPLVAVNQNALTTGSYQAFGTRQNSFFSSYYRGASGWLYTMGNFAQQAHPLNDFAHLTIQRVNSSTTDTISLPYRSRFSSASKDFTNSASYRESNCVAVDGTNGYDIYSSGASVQAEYSAKPLAHFQQQPSVSTEDTRREPMNVMVDSMPLSNIALPPELEPPFPLKGSYSVAQFYILNDQITGVLALGSFSAYNYSALQIGLLTGFEELKALGAKQLIVDVTNNGGGYICIAHWLHRIIIGPKDTTEPQAGLDTTARAGPLAQLIVKKVTEGADPEEGLLYNAIQWTNASHIPFSEGTNWLQPTVNLTINGRSDTFSQRLGQECQPFAQMPPDEPLFDSKKVVIVSNGRCASSCSLFSITMAKEEGVKTVVVGGKNDVSQQYCGTVGGQSTDFSTIDTEIKTTHLKNHDLAPPDLLTNSVQGITWRLGFGIDNTKEPEEWQDHPADFNLPLTIRTVNNPLGIWEAVVSEVFATPRPAVFRIQVD